MVSRRLPLEDRRRDLRAPLLREEEPRDAERDFEKAKAAAQSCESAFGRGEET